MEAQRIHSPRSPIGKEDSSPHHQLLMKRAMSWGLHHLDCESYALRCLSFVEDCLEKGSGILVPKGTSAKQMAALYRVTPREEIPPPGVLVFYDSFGPIQGMRKNWGHVGLSLGEGDVIHAWDRVRIDHYLEIEKLPVGDGWSQPVYLGWVPVDLSSQARDAWPDPLKSVPRQI